MSTRPSNRQHFEKLSGEIQQQLQVLKAKSTIDHLDLDLVKDTLRELYRVLDGLAGEVAEEELPETLVRPIEIQSAKPVMVSIPVTEEPRKEEMQAMMAPDTVEQKISVPEAVTNPREEVIEEKQDIPAEVLPLVAPEVKKELQDARKNAYAETLAKSAPSTIGSRYAKEETLSDRIANAAPQQRLSDSLQQKPLEDLRLSIGLNERFKFINELFEGNQQSFYAAIDKLNNAGSLDQAKAELDNLVATYGWQSNHNQVLEFTGLVQRRFNS